MATTALGKKARRKTAVVTAGGQDRQPELLDVKPPNYAKYGRYPYIVLRVGVALVHGFEPSPSNFRRLQQQAPGFAKAFEDDLAIARQWVGHEDLPVKPGELVPANPKQRGSVSVGTVAFVEWVKGKKLLLTAPNEEFLKMAPVRPPEDASASTAVGQATAGRPKQAATTSLGAATKSADLTLALLLLYVQRLAIRQEASGSSLLIGTPGRVNVSQLANNLHGLCAFRVDQTSSKALTTSGVSVETLGKRIREALELVDAARSAEKEAGEASGGRGTA